MVEFTIVAMTAVPALAQHADIRPGAEAGQLVTGAYADDSATFTPGVRVFGYDFGEDPLDPYFAADPGFNAAAGSGLPAGQPLLFNILSGPAVSGTAGNLSFWDGSGGVVLGAAGASTSIRLNLGAQNRVIDSGTAEVAGFVLGTIDAGGAVHRHLNAFLERTGGGSPAAGVYVFAIELSAAGAADSEPFWLVYNAGLSEVQHDAVIEFVNDTLVPEPGGLGLAGLAALALGRRRR